MRIIYVRHGQFSTFNVLVERCRLLDDVDVRWDRRLGALDPLGDDRRSAAAPVTSERRGGERRRMLSPDLELRGYNVVDDARPGSARKV
jgi:hypothetical protein